MLFYFELAKIFTVIRTNVTLESIQRACMLVHVSLIFLVVEL
jgi:hypothetical protein